MVHSMKFDWSFIVLPYGDVWRRKRKILSSYMSSAASPQFHPVQATCARRFAQDILTADMSPKGLYPAVSLYLGQLHIKAVYGIDVEDEQSPWIQLPQQVVTNFTITTVPGRFLIDLFPLCELHTR
jgi:cytochrome P450